MNNEDGPFDDWPITKLVTFNEAMEIAEAEKKMYEEVERVLKQEFEE